MNTPEERPWDLLVIGGGINGAGIAADAAGRGLKVLLCEMQDLGAATSSASSKLIHGGLRYLEQFEFRLVRESLSEREILLRTAPHVVEPLTFRLPLGSPLRTRWKLWLGLKLYDLMARRRSLPSSRSIRFTGHGPLNSDYRRGFEYTDCRADDARLVLLNALRARDQGAQVWTRSECEHAEVRHGQWHVRVADSISGERRTVGARAIVNAAGPWVGNPVSSLQRDLDGPAMRLVKGSHIVVPRIEGADCAYLLQNSDGRIVFVIPWENDYSMIGTTEENFDGDPHQARISDAEQQYLLDAVNRYFRAPLQAHDIVHRFAGVRALADGDSDNMTRASRDYRLTLRHRPAPLLTVEGGKLTTYRRLAEAAMTRLQPLFPQLGAPWTADSPLPGGDFESRATLAQSLRQRYPWLAADIVARWVRNYGTRCQRILDGCKGPEDLGENLGHGLHERELRYLCDEEWAVSADDVLWRRSKLGLRFDSVQRASLQRWLDAYQGLEQGMEHG